MKLSQFQLPIAIFFLIVLWSSSFVGIRIGLEGYTPGALALLRFLVASLAVLPFYFSLKKRQKITLEQLPLLFLMGAIGIGGYNIFLNEGERVLTAGVASFIMGLMPLMTVVLAISVLKERASFYVFLGIAVSLFGLGLIAFGNRFNVTYEDGVLLTLGAAICGAIYNIIQKPLLKQYHPIEIAAFIMWGGAFVLLVFMPDLRKEITHAPLSATLSGVYMGIFSAAIGYALWSYIVYKLPASQAVVFLYMLPITTIILGYLFLKELPTLISILGGLIALIGAFFASYLHHRFLKTR